MGQEWLKSIGLDWRAIGLATMNATETKLHTLLETYKAVFHDELRTVNSAKAELKLKDSQVRLTTASTLCAEGSS